MHLSVPRPLPNRSLAISLLLPPSVNKQYRYWRGRVVLTQHAREWRESMALLVRSVADNIPERPAGSDRLAVAVRLYFPDRRRRDLDNVLKLLLDATCEALDCDDSRVDELHVYRAHDSACPRAEILVCW